MPSAIDRQSYYPYRLQPVVKPKIWGGRNLETVVGKTLPPNEMVGETWEAWEECIVENGRHQGSTLQEVVARDAVGVLGSAQGGGRRFPLLFKFIDAQDDLSVQVHPDDAQAQAMENYPYGKTEAWYILQAQPGGRLILGFNRDVRLDEIAARVKDNTLVELMAEVPVRPGDVLFVAAGTVHAIGRGIVLAEIQENSDITYRLYDWGRAAKGRDLHVDASLKVLSCARLAEPQIPALTIHYPTMELRYHVACRYFALEELDIRERSESLSTGGRFQIVTTIQGQADVAYGDALQFSVEAKQGQTFLLPAQLGSYVITPRGGPCRVLRMYVPDLRQDIVAPLVRAGYDRARIDRLGGPVADHNDLRDIR